MGEFENRAKLRILDALADPVIIHDAQGQIHHANLAALNFFSLANLGAAQKESIIARYSASLPMAEEFSRQIKQTREVGTVAFEWQMHIPGDRVRTISVQSTYLKDWKDQDYFLTHFWDISSIKGVLEALHESETKFRFMADNSADVIWYADKEFRFTYVSPSDQKIRGFTPEELIGQSFFGQLTPADAEYAKKTNEIRMKDEKRGIKTGMMHFELQQLCKDGRLVWTDISINPYRDNTGNLIGYHGIARDITERKQAEGQLKEEKKKLEQALDQLRAAREELEYLANYDKLTGLMNRRYFQEITEKELKRSIRYHHPLVMVMVDFDNFKLINDRYGHALGDEVIIRVAKFLQDTLRQHDHAARMSGDEFVLLLPETNREQGVLIAERLRKNIADQTTTLSNGAEISLTCSFGVAEFDPEDPTFINLYRVADEAMYKAKSMGKNRTEVGGFIQ